MKQSTLFFCSTANIPVPTSVGRLHPVPGAPAGGPVPHRPHQPTPRSAAEGQGRRSRRACEGSLEAWRAPWSPQAAMEDGFTHKFCGRPGIINRRGWAKSDDQKWARPGGQTHQDSESTWTSLRDSQRFVVPALKTCPRCKERLPTSLFHKRTASRDGLNSACRACHKKARIAYKPNKCSRRGALLRYKYGISLEIYEEMLVEQGGVCAICKQPPDLKIYPGVLHVDHDHITGNVRSLLCSRCNKGLGSFNDDFDLVKKAAGYLEAYLCNAVC